MNCYQKKAIELINELKESNLSLEYIESKVYQKLGNKVGLQFITNNLES